MFFINGKGLSDTPTKSELEKLTIDDLVRLAKNKRSIKHPFKEALIKYVQSLGEIGKIGKI